MISYIKGTVLTVNYSDKLGSFDVLTSGGVGYEVLASKRLLATLTEGTPVEVFTHMQVREDDQYLCGFESRIEKDLFKLLTTVSGIGAKTAMAIISEYNSDALREIIKDSDAKRLSKVSGLGVKGAQKIILELTGKLDTALLKKDKNVGGNEVSANAIIVELNDALFSLGFRGVELQKMIVKAEKLFSDNPAITIESLIETILKG